MYISKHNKSAAQDPDQHLLGDLVKLLEQRLVVCGVHCLKVEHDLGKSLAATEQAKLNVRIL